MFIKSFKRVFMDRKWSGGTKLQLPKETPLLYYLLRYNRNGCSDTDKKN